MWSLIDIDIYNNICRNILIVIKSFTQKVGMPVIVFWYFPFFRYKFKILPCMNLNSSGPLKARPVRHNKPLFVLVFCTSTSQYLSWSADSVTPEKVAAVLFLASTPHWVTWSVAHNGQSGGHGICVAVVRYSRYLCGCSQMFKLFCVTGVRYSRYSCDWDQPVTAAPQSDWILLAA